MDETVIVLILGVIGFALAGMTARQFSALEKNAAESCPQCGADWVLGSADRWPWEMSAGGWPMQCPNCGNVDPRLTWLAHEDEWSA